MNEMMTWVKIGKMLKEKWKNSKESFKKASRSCPKIKQNPQVFSGTFLNLSTFKSL
jgi:hypothetical protein